MLFTSSQGSSAARMFSRPGHLKYVRVMLDQLDFYKITIIFDISSGPVVITGCSGVSFEKNNQEGFFRRNQ